MPSKPAKNDKKTPERRKRATPIKFNDDKVDSIVREITENLKKEEAEGSLEEEIKSEVEEKIAAGAGFNEAKRETEETEEKEAEAAIDKDDRPEDDTDKGEGDEAGEEPEPEKGEEKATDEDREEQKEEQSEDRPIFAPDKTDNPFPPIEDEPKKSFKWPIIYFILFLAGIGTGFIIFDQLSNRGGMNLFSMTAPTPTQTPTPSATPTPEAPNLSEYSIVVQNGSGIGGEAARLQNQLDEAGFTVSDIGNADASDYEQTVIRVKNGTNSAFLTALREELAKTYVVADGTEDLPEDEEADAVVIIGSEKAGDETVSE